MKESKKIKKVKTFISDELIKSGFNFLYAGIFIIIFAILGMVIECLFMKFSNKASTARLASDIFIQLTIDLFERSSINSFISLFEMGFVLQTYQQ